MTIDTIKEAIAALDRRRLLIAAVWGAVFGFGASLATIQSGRLDAGTARLIAVVMLFGLLSLAATLLSNLRRARIATLIAAGVLVVGAIVMAQTPPAAAQSAIVSGCPSFVVNGIAIGTAPPAGELGSSSEPIRLKLVDGGEISIATTTGQRYQNASMGLQVVKPLPIDGIDIDPSAMTLNGQDFTARVAMEQGWLFEGLVLRTPGDTHRLTAGVMRIFGNFDDGACPYSFHIQLLAPAWSTSLGRLGLALAIAGAAGMATTAVGPAVRARRHRALHTPGPPIDIARPVAIGAPSVPPPPASVDRQDRSGLQVDRRIVHARIEVDGRPVEGLVGGETNTVIARIAPALDQPLRGDTSSRALELVVTLDWSAGIQTRYLSLPADETATSDEVAFEVAIPAEANFVGDLTFVALPLNKTFVWTRIDGRPGTKGPGASLRLTQISRHDELLAPSTGAMSVDPMTWSWTERDRSLLCHGPSGATRYLTADLDRVSTELLKEISAVSDAESAFDWTDLALREVLLKMAWYGSNLLDGLAAQGFDRRTLSNADERMQVYSGDPVSPVPFEFVYDRGYPSADYTIDPDCIAALGDPNRTRCNCPPALALTQKVRANNPILCPFGFWGLSKVIERYTVDLTASTTIAHPSTADTHRDVPAVFDEPVIDLTGPVARVIPAGSADLAFGLREILATELDAAAIRGDRFGDAIRSARQQIFAAGHPSSILLAAQGDTDWQLRPTPQPVGASQHRKL